MLESLATFKIMAGVQELVYITLLLLLSALFRCNRCRFLCKRRLLSLREWRGKINRRIAGPWCNRTYALFILPALYRDAIVQIQTRHHKQSEFLANCNTRRHTIKRASHKTKKMHFTGTAQSAGNARKHAR